LIFLFSPKKLPIVLEKYCELISSFLHSFHKHFPALAGNSFGNFRAKLIQREHRIYCFNYVFNLRRQTKAVKCEKRLSAINKINRENNNIFCLLSGSCAASRIGTWIPVAILLPPLPPHATCPCHQAL